MNVNTRFFRFRKGITFVLALMMLVSVVGTVCTQAMAYGEIAGMPDAELLSGDISLFAAAPSQRSLALIPKPASYTALNADYTVQETARLVVSADVESDYEATKFAADYLASIMRSSTGYALPVIDSKEIEGSVLPTDIVLKTVGIATAAVSRAAAGEEDFAIEEEYSVNVNSGGVSILAFTPKGLFRGIQTIRQLLPASIEKDTTVTGVDWTMPYCVILDYPRYEYRGIMLDISRHYHSPEEVKRQIDLMTQFKMNVMHLHMTEDQGYRLASDIYPELTAFGGATGMNAGLGTPSYGQKPGYYTKEDFTDIIQYAAQRHVDVIPEIEFPSHNSGMLFSLPLLNKDGELPQGSLRSFVTGSVGYSITSDPNEDKYTREFMVNIINEIAAMTKSKYIHIGGDEAHAMTTAEYAAAVQPVIDTVHANGKMAIQWNQASSNNNEFPFVDVMQNWATSESDAGNYSARALANGSKVLASIARRAYIDHPTSRSIPFFGMTWANRQGVNMHTAYQWDPEEAVPEAYRDQGNVIGLEAPLWAENVGAKFGYDATVYPRIMGYAEIGWSPKEDRITGRTNATVNDAASLEAARANPAYLDYENRIGEGEYNKRMYNQGIVFFNYPQLWDNKSIMTVAADSSNKRIDAATAINTAVSGTIPFTPGDNITEDDNITLILGAEPSQGKVEFDNDGNWTYSANNNFIGTDGFTIVFSVDGYGIPVASNPTPGNSQADRVENAYANVRITVNGEADVTYPVEASFIVASSTNIRVAFNPPVPDMNAGNFSIPGATVRVAYTFDNGSSYFLITTRRNESVSDKITVTRENYSINEIALPKSVEFAAEPAEYVDYEGAYKISANSKIVAPSGLLTVAETLASDIAKKTGVTVPVAANDAVETAVEPTSDDIVLKLVDKTAALPLAYNYGMKEMGYNDIGDNGYRAYVDINEGVVISAYSEKGLSAGAKAVPELIGADNTISYSVMSDVIGFRASITVSDESVTATYRCSADAAYTEQEVLCIVTQFDEEGKLVGFEQQTVKLGDYANNTLSIQLPKVGVSAKAFIWNAQTFVPLFI